MCCVCMSHCSCSSFVTLKKAFFNIYTVLSLRILAFVPTLLSIIKTRAHDFRFLNVFFFSFCYLPSSILCMFSEGHLTSRVTARLKPAVRKNGRLLAIEVTPWDRKIKLPFEPLTDANSPQETFSFRNMLVSVQMELEGEICNR